MQKSYEISLGRFNQKLRDYQENVVRESVRRFQEDPQGRVLFASPTGTGKGTVELALLQTLRDMGVDAWIVTPSLEVIRGFLERCGGDDLSEASGENLAELGERIYVTTPVRLRNRVLTGDRGMPEAIIYDEVHHAVETNKVAGLLFSMAPDAAWFGFTATPYRGSPRATKDLRDAWGDVVEVYSIPGAVKDGWMSLPTFHVVPLVDDDKIKVVGGKFQIKSAAKESKNRIDDLADFVAEWLAADRDSTDPQLDVVAVTPTVITVPSSDVASWLCEALESRGVAADWINAKTPAKVRAASYRRCETGESVLVSIAVITEGVDLPWLGRLIDCRPLISPVAWVQQLGRIMRPKEKRPEYVCTNRNLERHAYLLQGMVPREKFAEVQQAFEKPSDRDNMRRVGLESMRKFKAIPLPLLDGTKAYMYSLWSTDVDGVKTEYVTILDPVSDKQIVAMRGIPRVDGETAFDYKAATKWARCELPDDLVGFQTSGHRFKLTPGQRRFWNNASRRVGLDPAAVDELTWRQFAALPVLLHLKERM